MSVHPFVWIRESSRPAVFWLFAGLAILTMAALQLLGGPLTTDAAPAGIVSFELAGDLPAADRILESWDWVTRVYAGVNLGLDYLFIDAYVGAIGLGCVLVGAMLGHRARALGQAGNYLAWAVAVAGALDCVENFALIRLLLGSQHASLAAVAQWCAVPKFLLVLAGLLYVVLGLLVLLVSSRRGLPSDGA